MADIDSRRSRLGVARLYLVCDSQPAGRTLDAVVAPALAGGVDIVQLRDKQADDDALLEAAGLLRGLCDRAGALLIVNDRPDLAVAADADGVHLGQDDMCVSQARAIVGERRLIGLSTHSPEQVEAATGVDYIGVGPVHRTPTKAGRPPAGVALVRHTAAHAGVPFFAIGGIDPGNVHEVLEAGATRVAVVRAIAESADPQGAAAALRAAVERSEVAFGVR